MLGNLIGVSTPGAPNDRHCTIRMPAELYDQLTERAQLEERSPAGLIRLLARLYVEAPPGAPLYPAGAPSAASSAA